MGRWWVVLVPLWGLGCVEEDTGQLCTSGNNLKVLFSYCSSSARRIHVKECTGEEVDGEWVLTTRYRESGSSDLPDCRAIETRCPKPPPGMPVRIGDDEAVPMDALESCYDIVDRANDVTVDTGR